MIRPYFSALQRIEQHFKCLNEIVKEYFGHNLSRVQENSLQFQKALMMIYERGEGWIEEDVHHLLEAVEFAAYKHQKQVRKDKGRTPYLVHPLSVAHHLLTVGSVRDPDIIIAGLFHDILEDTETSYQELVNLFGERVAAFVQEVTDDKNLPKEERKRLQIVTAPHKSAGAAQIKLADKWDNLSDLLTNRMPDWSEQRIQDYFKWAKSVIEALPWVNASLLSAVRRVLSTHLPIIIEY
jgi:(p)ppGpp synthase/HD superfamily hydrolase